MSNAEVFARELKTARDREAKELKDEFDAEIDPARKKDLIHFYRTRILDWMKQDLTLTEDPEEKAKIETRITLQEFTMRPDEELEKLPTYTQYFDSVLSKRENYINIMRTGLYQNLIIEMQALREMMMECSKDTSTFKQDSPEFKEKSTTWWMCYRSMMADRSYVCLKYGIPMPSVTEIMPERLYCGVPICHEDFEMWVKKTMHGKGVKELKPESEHDYTNKV